MGDKKRMTAEAAKRNDNIKSTTKLTKTQVVLRDLKRNSRNGITSLEMFNKYSITRLAVHIHSLRKRGYVIDTIIMESGNGSRYGKYILREEPK